MKLQSQSDDEDIVAFLLDHLGYAFVNLRPKFWEMLSLIFSTMSYHDMYSL